MANVDSILSNKIKVGMFLCTIMVLYRHSVNYLAFFNSWEGFGINKIVQGTIGYMTEIAVPFFFIISGFFFFKYTYYKKKNFITMIKKKSKSLLLPFAIWNIIGVLFLLMYSKDKVGSTFTECLYNFLSSEWNGPMWYIRDLILLMILVPLYNWIFIYNKIFLHFIILLILFYNWTPIDCNILSSEAILFFYIGGLLRYKNRLTLIKMKRPLFLIFTTIWLFFSTGLINSNLLTHKLNIFIGIISFWWLLDLINNTLWNKILKIAKYSFIIYAMHTYIIKLIKHLMAYFYFGNEFVALLTYITAPLFTAFFIIIIAQIWEKKSNYTYKLATGGR